MDSVQASGDEPPAQGRARVARTVVCENMACSVLPLAHLSIEILEVPLQHDQATAISYTWGEFDRTKVPIGHLVTDGNNIVSVELGKEWVVSDFIDRLGSLSSQRPIWLDQLCIPQRDEAIRQALASVPTIYRTFDVAVLMPGRPCRCLGDFLAETAEADANADPESAETVDSLGELVAKYSRCLNFTAPSSWASRLWPRQELMYSQRIRCVWAARDAPPCVPELYGDEEAAHLAPYLASMRESLLSQGYTERQVGFMLRSHLTDVDNYAVTEVLAYAKGMDGTGKTTGAAFFEFLAGKLLDNGTRTMETMDDFVTGLNFMTNSFSFNQRTRTATQTRDYVLSVWIDCPGYTVPSDFKRVSLGGLMQNAAEQLATNHNLNLLTTAPRGLFDATSPRSTCWDPEQYFTSAQVNSLRDVYGPVYTDPTFFHSSSSGRVPLTLTPNGYGPLSMEAQEYDLCLEDLRQGLGEKEAKQVIILQLSRMIQNWTESSFSAVRDSLITSLNDLAQESRLKYPHGLPPGMVEEVLPLVLMAKLLGEDEVPDELLKPLYNNISETFEEMLWGTEHIETVLYGMMAVALRLDVNALRDKSVKIMLSGGTLDTMRLGFCRGDIDILSVNSQAEMDEIKSVRMNPDLPSQQKRRERGGLIFEAVKVGGLRRAGELLPAFRVFGVWIPLQNRTERDCNAELMMRDGQRNQLGALLV